MSGVSPISAGESGSFTEQYLRLIEDWLREFVDKNKQQQDADNQPEIEITVKERIVYGQGVNDLSPSILERLGQLQNTPVGGIVESAVSMRVKLDGKVVLESDESGKVITNSFYEQLRDNKNAHKITNKYALDNPFVNDELPDEYPDFENHFVNEEELPDEYADFENLFINNELPDEYPDFNNLFVNDEFKAEDNQIVNGEREPNLGKVVPQQPDSVVTYPTLPPVQQTPVVTETGGARVKTALEALPDSSLKQLLTAQLSQMQELQRSQLQNQQRQFDEFIKARFTEPKNTNWWQQAAHSVANTAQTAWASLVRRSHDVKAAVAIKSLFDQSTSPGATAYHTAGYTIARSGQSYSLSDKSGKTLMQFDASPIGVRVSPSSQLTTSAHQDLKQLRISQSRGEEPGGAFARVGKKETEYFARVNAITTALSQYAQRQGTNVQVDGQFSYKWKATPDGKVRIDAKDGRGSLLIKAQGQMKTRMSERDLAYFEQMLPILQQSTPQRQNQLSPIQSQKQSPKQLERA
ncbi:hypothetical protein OGM63_19255 [Plectonema radiosum NIES-515]|uniref:Uncharacterized protein n=1 Tax=Plectonema radiosum NIES-515 TaxID=2986073 RepID=A0ABT3B2M8_9CYAN|nr:hypothetical protein [Plectonema radiosum]MCV3215624.1 hypothetical protein [Plectonema radiosum NIES-515]